MIAIAAWTAILFGADPIPKEIVVESGNLKRFIQLQPVFRTTRILNTATGDEIKPAADTPEFVVETMDGRRFTTEDFVVEEFKQPRLHLTGRENKDLLIIVDSTFCEGV